MRARLLPLARLGRRTLTVNAYAAAVGTVPVGEGTLTLSHAGACDVHDTRYAAATVAFAFVP